MREFAHSLVISIRTLSFTSSLSFSICLNLRNLYNTLDKKNNIPVSQKRKMYDSLVKIIRGLSEEIPPNPELLSSLTSGKLPLSRFETGLGISEIFGDCSKESGIFPLTSKSLHAIILYRQNYTGGSLNERCPIW
ncbi:MAG: hypothetical protein HYY56_04120 [Candidatus Omnitrophica bacterium]|nr:hypothetical protein [Candidatus Omnitrophota bacterium]